MRNGRGTLIFKGKRLRSREISALPRAASVVSPSLELPPLHPVKDSQIHPHSPGQQPRGKDTSGPHLSPAAMTAPFDPSFS